MLLSYSTETAHTNPVNPSPPAPNQLAPWEPYLKLLFSGALRNDHSFLPEVPSTAASKDTSLLPSLIFLSLPPRSPGQTLPFPTYSGIHGDPSYPLSHFTHCHWSCLCPGFHREAMDLQVLVCSSALSSEHQTVPQMPPGCPRQSDAQRVWGKPHS